MDYTVFGLITLFSLTHTVRGKILLIVYVDDIIITSDDKEGIDKLRSFLQSLFQSKDLRKICYFLGVEVAWSKKGIRLSQRKCLLDIYGIKSDAGQPRLQHLEQPCNLRLHHLRVAWIHNQARKALSQRKFYQWIIV